MTIKEGKRHQWWEWEVISWRKSLGVIKYEEIYESTLIGKSNLVFNAQVSGGLLEAKGVQMNGN